MIVEQIRYFIAAESRENLIAVRRDIAQIRQSLDLPAGRILLSDLDGEEGPGVVWQCAYEDESQLGLVETRLMDSDEYDAARNRITTLVTRVELELYTGDEETIEISPTE